MAKNKLNKLLACVRDYLMEYLPNQKNSSEHTIISYRTSLNSFFDHLTKERNVKLKDVQFDMVTKELVISFLDSVEASGSSASTRNHKLQAIRSFLKYAASCDVAQAAYYSEIMDIPKKKHSTSLTVDYMTPDDTKLLLSMPDGHTAKGIRDMFIMVLIYDSAARVQELVNIRIKDVHDIASPSLDLYGKGRKKRTVPLMPATMEHYYRYMEVFHPQTGNDPEEPLFYTERKGIRCAISDDTIRVFMKKYADMARLHSSTIPESVYPHLLRHSRAMHLYQNGMDLSLIAQWLGHADIKTTLIYAHADMDMKRKAISQATDGYATQAELAPPKYDINDDEVLKRLISLIP